jgi:hypothetical protein
LSNATVSGADAALFTVVAQPTNNGLGSGNSTSFTINFTPLTAGTKNATVTFNVYIDAGRTVSEPIDPIYTFAISGNGIMYIHRVRIMPFKPWPYKILSPFQRHQPTDIRLHYRWFG